MVWLDHCAQRRVSDIEPGVKGGGSSIPQISSYLELLKHLERMLKKSVKQKIVIVMIVFKSVKLIQTKINFYIEYL